MEQLIKKYKEIKDNYARLGSSYSDTYILQDIKAELTILFGDFGDYVMEYRDARNSYDHGRQVKLSCIIVELMERNEKLSKSQAEVNARCDNRYQNYLDEMSNAIANWDTLKHYIEATKLLSFTVGSHIDNLKKEKY